MVIKPSVEVNSVPDGAPTEANRLGADAGKQSNPNANVFSGLSAREAAPRGEGQGRVILSHRPYPCGSSAQAQRLPGRVHRGAAR